MSSIGNELVLHVFNNSTTSSSLNLTVPSGITSMVRLKTDAFNDMTSQNVSLPVSGTISIPPKSMNSFVMALNQPPTDISLSSSSISEDKPSGSIVGNLSAVNNEGGDTLTYSLVSGSGDSDNASFIVDGVSLKTAAALDFETKNSYSIRLNVNDGTSDFPKTFTISITNVNEAPQVSNINLTAVEQIKLNIELTGTDPEQTSASVFKITDLPNNGTLSHNGSVISSVPYTTTKEIANWVLSSDENKDYRSEVGRALIQISHL